MFNVAIPSLPDQVSNCEEVYTPALSLG